MMFKNNEERIQHLEYTVSTLTDYVVQVVEELNEKGIKVSTTLKDPVDREEK